MIRPFSNTPAALLALQDALEVEILNAPAEEIRTALTEVARPPDDAYWEVRSLIADAVRASEDQPEPLLPQPVHDGSALRRNLR